MRVFTTLVYGAIAWRIMASPNFGWKNAMPASSIRAGRRRRARPILAANFTGGCADLDTTAGVGRATMDTGQTSLSRCGEAVGVEWSDETVSPDLLKEPLKIPDKEEAEAISRVPPTATPQSTHTPSLRAAPQTVAEGDLLGNLQSQNQVHLPSPDGGSAPTDLAVSSHLHSVPTPASGSITSIVRSSTSVHSVHKLQCPGPGSTELAECELKLPHAPLHSRGHSIAVKGANSFVTFPYTAFKISPMSCIIERYFPYQSRKHLLSLSPVSSGGETCSALREVDDEMLKLEPELDNEMEEVGRVEEKEEMKRRAEMIAEVEEEEVEKRHEFCSKSLPLQTVEEEMGRYNNSAKSLLAMDVEGLLMASRSRRPNALNGITLDSSVDVGAGSVASDPGRVRGQQKRARAYGQRVVSRHAEPGETWRRKRTKQRAKKMEEVEEGEERECGEATLKKKKSPKKSNHPVPNAFVAVRISSENIRSSLDAVQKEMVRKEQALRYTLISLDKLHITLSVVRLEKQDQERAKAALLEATQRAVTDLCLCENSLELEFCGLSSFGKRVVFARLVEGEGYERLRKIADTVRSALKSHGIQDTDKRGHFSPHLTLAKMSAYRWQGKRGRHPRLTGITEDHYDDFKETYFGVQRVEGLELLSMTLPLDADGYYHCFQRFSFDEFYLLLPSKQVVASSTSSGALESSKEADTESESVTPSPNTKNTG